QFGADFVEKMLSGMLEDTRLSVRELTANGIDASTRGSEIIKITIDETGLEWEDWGHGILDPKKFREIGTSLKLDPTSSARYFGVGRTTALFLGDKVYWRSNNGEIGMQFYLTRKGMSEGTIRGQTKFIDNVGTQM